MMYKSNRNHCHDQYMLQLQAVKQQWMSELSYELGKPVTNHLLFVELSKLLARESSDEKILEYLEAIEKVAMLLNQQDV